MKKSSLFLLLAMPAIAFVQTSEKMVLIEEARPEMTGELLIYAMPADTTVGEIVIGSKKEFESLFPEMDPEIVKEIDFKTSHIIGMPYCPLCLNSCNRIGGNCHQGKCSTLYYWYVASDSPVKEVDYYNLPTCESDLFFGNGHNIVDNDSLYSEIRNDCLKSLLPDLDFSREFILSKYSGGDCFAKYSNKIVLDTVQSKLIWKEFNVYGGCRSAGFFENHIVVPVIPSGYTIEIHEILIEQWFVR